MFRLYIVEVVGMFEYSTCVCVQKYLRAFVLF